MLKFLIGPALVGAGYAAGSYYGADAEQTVHKSPSATYEVIEQALNNMPTSGMTSFEGGTAVRYELKVERAPGEKLVATLFFEGKEGAAAELTFVPQNGGRDTLIKARIHADRSVLRPALAGTDKARLAYAPDWMLNLTFKPLLKQLAGEIESGQSAKLDGIEGGETQAQWEANLNDEQRGDRARWGQYEATAPALDPDAAARNSDRKDD